MQLIEFWASSSTFSGRGEGPGAQNATGRRDIHNATAGNPHLISQEAGSIGKIPPRPSDANNPPPEWADQHAQFLRGERPAEVLEELEELAELAELVNVQAPRALAARNPRPAAKQTKAQKRAAAKAKRARARERNLARDRARAEELAAQFEERGYAQVTQIQLGIGVGPFVTITRLPLRVVPTWVQNMILAILAEPTGAIARAALQRCSLRLLAAGGREAALCNGRYTWADDRARRIAAAVFFLDAMKVRHRASGLWQFKVDGVVIDFIRWLFRDAHVPMRPNDYGTPKRYPNGRRYRSARGVPSQDLISGTWGDTKRWEAGQCGAFTALRQIGVVYSPHNGSTDKIYATDSGYQPAEFYLRGDVLEADETKAAHTEAEILGELAAQAHDQNADARAPPLTN